MRTGEKGYTAVNRILFKEEQMATGPVGPGDPTTPAGPPPAYGPPPEQRFDRGPAYPPGYDPAQYPQHPQHRDYAAEAAAFSRRHIRTPETKEFYKTSEFVVWAFSFICVVMAGLISETLFSDKVWLYVTILSSAYMLSRGIAKAAARRGDPEGQRGHDPSA